MGLWLLTFAASKAVWTSGLAVIALIVQKSIRKPAVAHVAWLAVLVSLFAPALVTVNLPVLAALPTPQPTSSVDSRLSPQAPEMAVESELDTGASASTAARTHGGSAPLEGIAPFPLNPQSDHPSAVDFLPAFGWAGWTAIVWGCGLITWLLTTLVPLAKFRTQLHEYGQLDEEGSHRARALGAVWGLASAPPVYLVPGCVSPLICGVGRDTKILFPAELWRNLNDSARDSLLLHELAHFRRGDHWVRLLEYVACGLFWWHPAVWVARHYLEQAEEQCCDAWVAERFEGPARPYAEALLAAVDYVSNPQPVLPPLSSGIGDVPFLKLRLTQIMHRNVEKSIPATLRHYIAIAAGVAILAQPLIQLTPAAAAPSTMASLPLEVSPPAVTRPATAKETVSPVPRAPLVIPAGNDAWWQAGPPPVWAELTSPDGKYRLTAASGFAVQLAPVGTQPNPVTGSTIDLSTEEITCAQFFSLSQRFIAGSRDGRLRLFETATGLPVSLVGSHRGEVRSVALIPDEQYLVSAGGDGVVMLWDVETGALEAEWTAESTARTHVGQVRVSRDGLFVAVPIGHWNDPESMQVAILERTQLQTDRIFRPAGSVAIVEFSNDGRELLTIEWNGQARFWSRETGLLVATGQIGKDRVAEATFSPASRLWPDVTRLALPLQSVTPVVTRESFDR